MGVQLRENKHDLLSITISPASVAANTTAEQLFPVTGLNVGDWTEIVKPTTQAGLAIGNVRVSSANNVAVEFINDTAGAIVPTAAEVYLLLVYRPDGIRTAFSL